MKKKKKKSYQRFTGPFSSIPSAFQELFKCSVEKDVSNVRTFGVFFDDPQVSEVKDMRWWLAFEGEAVKDESCRNKLKTFEGTFGKSLVAEIP